MDTAVINVQTYCGPDRRRKPPAAERFSESDFGVLTARLSDSEVIRGIDCQITAITERLAAGSLRMGELSARLGENTAATIATSTAVQRIDSATVDIRELLETGKALFKFASGFGRFARWVGGLAGAAAAVWALIYAATHGGKPPG